MIQISEWCDTVEELRFIIDQVHKYDPDVCVVKRNPKHHDQWAVFRKDKED